MHVALVVMRVSETPYRLLGEFGKEKDIFRPRDMMHFLLPKASFFKEGFFKSFGPLCQRASHFVWMWFYLQHFAPFCLCPLHLPGHLIFLLKFHSISFTRCRHRTWVICEFWIEVSAWAIALAGTRRTGGEEEAERIWATSSAAASEVMVRNKKTPHQAYDGRGTSGASGQLRVPVASVVALLRGAGPWQSILGMLCAKAQMLHSVVMAENPPAD